MFAGKDASRAIAKWSMSKEDLNDNLVRTQANYHEMSGVTSYLYNIIPKSSQFPLSSRVAQWKRAGPITQRSEDQNLALLVVFLFLFSFTFLSFLVLRAFLFKFDKVK